MTRKLLIVAIFPLLAAVGCCSDDGLLHRIEVWKQQTFFAPAESPVIMAPMAPLAEPTCSAPAPVAVEPSCSAPVSQTVGSPEVIDGVLEQP